MKVLRLYFLNSAKLTGLTILLLSSIIGCTSIGPSTVELASETTIRIKDLHQVHTEAINQYFDFQEARVKEFIKREWTPLFLRNFLGTSGVINDINNASLISRQTQNELKHAVEFYLDDNSESESLVQELSEKLTQTRGGETSTVNQIMGKYIEKDKLPSAISHVMSLLGTDEPALIIMDFAQDAHDQILKQQSLMLKPLQDKRKLLLISINDRYEEVITAQGMITGRLEAASKQSQANSNLAQSIFGEGTEGKIREELLGFGDNVSTALTALSSAVDADSPPDDASLSDQLINIMKSSMQDKDITIDKDNN